jgi:ubiquinol-cytochrome c reductase cytochrome b subunit
VWYLGLASAGLYIALCVVGYVLPFGSMSFWAITVMINLTGVLPCVSGDLFIFIVGGFWIQSRTLWRFSQLHFMLPPIVAGVVGTHLLSIHTYGSQGITGVLSGECDRDLFGW